MIEIDEVLFGSVSLKGKSFQVETSNDTSYGVGCVSPVLKEGENAIWAVWESHGDPKWGSDGLKHIDPRTFPLFDPYSFSYLCPIREGNKDSYQKAPAIAAILQYLNTRKDWSDFDASLLRLIKDEKDPFISEWEKRLWQSYQPIKN